MIKRFSVALAALFVLGSQAFGAGTIPLSLSQQLDKFGKPLAGCILNIIQAGTVGTPQIAYQDTALTIPVPGGSRLTCDASGRIIQFFLADGNVKVILTDKNGVLQFTADNILVIGNSSGGGGGGGVDPTTVLATGDIKATYGTGILTGFVRANGRTIGSATSGASERANSDTQALFQYLWNADPNLVVPSGRGISANADWVANKQITLPDWRGRVVAGLGDMGNSDAGRITLGFLGSDPTILGSSGGQQAQTLITANLPPYTPGGSVGLALTGNITLQGFAQSGSSVGFTAASQGSNNGGAGNLAVNLSGSSAAFTGSAQGGTSSAFSVLPPMMLTTIYLKL